MAPECSIKRGFWVLAPNILKKRRPFCLQVSDMNLPQDLSRLLCSVSLHFCCPGFQHQEERGSFRWDLCWHLSWSPKFITWRIETSTGALLFWCDWYLDFWWNVFFKWEDFLGRNQSWCKRSLFLFPLFGKNKDKLVQLAMCTWSF